eukprot:330348-Alexandrium_andersonii.AAC.1
MLSSSLFLALQTFQVGSPKLSKALRGPAMLSCALKMSQRLSRLSRALQGSLRFSRALHSYPGLSG